MALPFLTNGTRQKREEILAVDLGSRTTKAVHLQRRNERMALCGYGLLDAPIFEKTLSAELLAEHLRKVAQVVGVKTKALALTVGVNDAVVRTVEVPRVPVDDLRLVLKHNAKTYLQQDLSGYVFDGHVLPAEQQARPAEGATGSPGMQKHKVLVAGAKQQLIDDLQAAARTAGFIPEQVVPGLIGPVNAFELAMPQVFQNECVGLVDIGFKNTSICLLQKGELILSRVMALGGDRLTSALSESMNISYAEAEGIKVGMPQEVQSTLETILAPLGKELRASIDFFEHQQDKTVTHVLVSGGSARSELILQTLQAELMVECQVWDPTESLTIELPGQPTADLEQVVPQLAVAVGTAVAAL